MQTTVVIREHLVDFNIHGHDVAVFNCLKRNQIVGAQLLELEQNLLNLDRKDVHTLQNHHVVAAALQTGKTFVVAATRATAWENAGQVAGPVAEQRHTLTIDSCQHQLTQLTVFNRLQRHRVDNLNDEIVFPNMQTILFLALKGHTRTHHLADSV